MGNLDLDEIIKRKTNTNKKTVRKSYDENITKTKKDEVIVIPYYPQDNYFIRAFKEFINSQKITLEMMEQSGFFKQSEAYNIIYNLKKPYKTEIDENGKQKKINPQFSWTRAEKMLDFLGYSLEFIFKKNEEE